MKCPKCGYENNNENLYCGLCYEVLNKETKPTEDFNLQMESLALEAIKIAATSYNIKLDFTKESIDLLESILEKLHNLFKMKTIKQENVGQQAYLWGSYIGEVVKKLEPAKWELDSVKAGKGAMPIIYRGKSEIYPCAWAYRRIINGSEDNISFKFEFFVLRKRKPEADIIVQDGKIIKSNLDDYPPGYDLKKKD